MSNILSRAPANGVAPLVITPPARQAPVQGPAVSNRVNSSSGQTFPPNPEFIVVQLSPTKATGGGTQPVWLPTGATSANNIMSTPVSLELRQRDLYVYAFGQNLANLSTTTAFVGLNINLRRSGQTLVTLPYSFINSPTGGNIGSDITPNNLVQLSIPNGASTAASTNNGLVLQPTTPVYTGGTAGQLPNEPASTVLYPFRVPTPIDSITVDLLPLMVTGGNLRIDVSTIRVVLISSAY